MTKKILSEISADAPILFVCISKIFQILDGTQKVVVENLKSLYEDRKTDNLN